MTVTGITAEYNPLHNGHAWQLEQARKLTGCDAIAVCMSGDYVQRGEPAAADKWTRTRLALENGADLVVEIPALFCLGNAFQYASASVAMLEELGCSHIAFGSESGDTDALIRVAAVLKEHQKEIAEGIAALVKEGKSYPAARAEIYRRIRDAEGCGADIADELSVLSSPNDILALEYISCMRDAKPAAIKRKGAGHDQPADSSGLSSGPDGTADIGPELRSASAIREMLREGLDISAYVPESTAYAMSESFVSDPGAWARILRYAAMSSSPETIEDCPSGGEGLGFLLKDAVKKHDGFDGIIKAVKSKRYTYSRISRLCMQLILGITREKYPMTAPLYIRVLGFNDIGRKVLSELRHREPAGLPVITNINKEAAELDGDARRLLGLDIHSADIFNLVNGLDISSCSDHKKKPVIL